MYDSENNDDFLFIDDSGDDEVVEESISDVWKVLIVDDDPEIHSVTQLALSSLVVLDRKLEYIHAYSGQEACDIIEQQPDIVLVLLDVVMETDDAGLNVVKYIRETLDRQDIRIVLRTGQPGYAPEESVIKDYDINDYKTKTELTRRKLVTTVYAAIRSYKQIQTVNQSRVGLEKVIGAAAELLELHSVEDYAKGVLKQLHILSQSSSCVFCARGQGIIEGSDDLSLYIIAQEGLPASLERQKVERLKNKLAHESISRCFQNKEHIFTDTNVALHLASGGYRAVVYIELSQKLTEIEQQLIQVFLTNIAIGYENVHLFHKLHNAAYQDRLTELPNRLAFISLLDDFSHTGEESMVAALIDINHFSDINDGLGQDLGNHLLIAVAERLKSLGAQCQISRVGADVFGIIGPETIVNPNYLVSLFSTPFSAGDQSLPVNVCIGLCAKADASTHGLKALNQINLALNLAKKGRSETSIYYKTEMEDRMLWRLGMIRQLRTDFADNRLELWYQPQLSLNTGAVIGAEALLRWRTAEGEFIPPDVFIPLAEYSGLILDIGDWVIEQACMQINTLEANGFVDVGISVNVSIPQFRKDDFVESLINTTKVLNVSPEKLELEITENVLMDEPRTVVEALTKLKGHGIRIALDDFGTGYSSLSYLQTLPLDRLKVDRSFITHITETDQSTIADTIIGLGKQMGLTVIAEGVEELAQQEHLKQHGCDEVQGYYYARPLPKDEFLAFLKKR